MVIIYSTDEQPQRVGNVSLNDAVSC